MNELVCVCVFKHHNFLAESAKLRTERECRDYCSLTDVIPNTAPKCCVPPQSLSEGLFKKQPHTTGLLCALFLIYSQHKFKAEVAQHDLEENSCRQFSRFYSNDQHGGA